MAEQPRQPFHKKANTLRRPPPHPQINPAIEAWLARVPSTTTKLTPEELKQWKLHDQANSGKGSFITAVVLRVLSLLSAFITAVIGFVQLHRFHDFEGELLLPLIIPGVLISVFDACEFIVVCSRGGRGMPRRIHLFADFSIFVLVSASMAGMWLGLGFGGYWNVFGWSNYSRGYPESAQYLVAFLFLCTLLIIHSFFFCFLLCSRRFRKNPKLPTPRVMYLSTGDPVVVFAEPYPREAASHQQPRESPPVLLAELPRLADNADGATLPSPRTDLAISPAETRPLHLPAESPAAATPPRASLTLVPGRTGSYPQGVPTRKPVPASASWPPPEYEPDQAEKERAARGEAQAQWMTLAHSGIDSKKGSGTQTAYKSNLFPSQRGNC